MQISTRPCVLKDQAIGWGKQTICARESARLFQYFYVQKLDRTKTSSRSRPPSTQDFRLVYDLLCRLWLQVRGEAVLAHDETPKTHHGSHILLSQSINRGGPLNRIHLQLRYHAQLLVVSQMHFRRYSKASKSETVQSATPTIVFPIAGALDLSGRECMGTKLVKTFCLLVSRNARILGV